MRPDGLRGIAAIHDARAGDRLSGRIHHLSAGARVQSRHDNLAKIVSPAAHSLDLYRGNRSISLGCDLRFELASRRERAEGEASIIIGGENGVGAAGAGHLWTALAAVIGVM